MEEELNKQDREELEVYRKIVREAANKEVSFSNKLANWTGTFVAYGAIVILLWVCWNWSLIKLWPQIPEITPLQMAGLWYLLSTLIKK